MYAVDCYSFWIGDCRSKTDTERKILGHIVGKRIKNFGVIARGRAVR